MQLFTTFEVWGEWQIVLIFNTGQTKSRLIWQDSNFRLCAIKSLPWTLAACWPAGWCCWAKWMTWWSTSAVSASVVGSAVKRYAWFPIWNLMNNNLKKPLSIRPWQVNISNCIFYDVIWYGIVFCNLQYHIYFIVDEIFHGNLVATFLLTLIHHWLTVFLIFHF